MSALQYRSSIVLAAVSVVLLSSRPAPAQGVGAPHHQHGGALRDLSTGVWYDRSNQAQAEHFLPFHQAKLRRDIERGHTAAAEHDALKVDELQHRIVVSEWLIRKNACQENGYYPYPPRLDPMSFCAIGQYRVPPRPPGRR